VLEQEVNEFQMRLASMRVGFGYTQKDLSVRTGIDHAYICRLEKGNRENPSLKILLRLCKGLDCSLNELTGK